MAFVLRISLTILVVFTGICQNLELRSGAYEDFVVQISDAVPQANCKLILANLEETLAGASQYLFSALHGRAFLRSTTIVLPSSWPDSCTSKVVVSGSGETPDMTVLPNDPTRGRLWTQQSAGCGLPGDQMYLGYQALENKDSTLAHSLVKEFAIYRYGVFEEQGYTNDPIYPMCFYDDKSSVKVTGCSDFPIKDNGICNNSSNVYNITQMVDPRARTSIMFGAEAPSVSMFCDDGNHDRYAPTKHNSICQRRNTFDVILSHSDFASSDISYDGEITNTTCKIVYKRQKLTRYVLVIDNTKDMSERESWSFLRNAVRKWFLLDLPGNTEVGLILTSESRETLSIQKIGDNNNRDRMSSRIPYTPSDATQSPCLHCVIKTALTMFSQRSKEAGPASNVIVVIAPGMTNSTQIRNITIECSKQKVRIATINYPNTIREHPLDILAQETNGAMYTVIEKKANVESSLLSTYFQLCNALYNIVETFYAGNINDVPLEIHRREINDGRPLVRGSFVLEDTMGEPARFMLYTHNSVTPLIKDIQLVSPGQVYAARSDFYLNFKIITMQTNISEPGTWTYTVEPFPGNPQPHFVQVLATARSKTAPIIRALFWIRKPKSGGPLVLFAQVKRGEYPIQGAKVEVQSSKAEANGSISYRETFELFDTGSGDPDITKGDGIYTRYYSASRGGNGIYTFEVTVTDNGNTAYTWHSSSSSSGNIPCCGSIIPSPKKEILSPFQRVLTPVRIEITANDIVSASQVLVGRILDLKVEIIPEDMKGRLSWTAPDMGGQNVARYEIKYANSIRDIADHFETSAKTWTLGQPFPLASGSETTFALDMSQDKDLLDKPLYFAIRAIPHTSMMSTISNWVRVLVPSPPPPATVPPTYSINDQSAWPYDTSNVGVDPVRPSLTGDTNVGLEIILPIVIGCLLLIAMLVLYFCFCVKRRNRDDRKQTVGKMKNDKINSNITIVPHTSGNNPQPAQQQGYTNQINETDHHTVGVPINNYGYEDEPKKRYSLVQQQEQQYIEELKQQQMIHQQRELMNTPSNNYGGLSVISNGTLQRNPPALSPYNSWSASQLLHEHERRQSPMENVIQDDQQQEMLINGSQIDHMSLNGQNMDHISLNSHQIPEHYGAGHIPPPVPPLPAFNSNGYPVNYGIYGVHQPQMVPNPNHAIYQTMQRNEAMVPFSSSLQGSMNSVNSGEKKRRNVTMV